MFGFTVKLPWVGSTSSAGVSAPEQTHTRGSTSLPAPAAAQPETSLKNSTVRIQNGTPSLREEKNLLSYSSVQEERDRRAIDSGALPRMTIKDGGRSEDAGSFQTAGKQSRSEARDVDPDTAMSRNHQDFLLDPLAFSAAPRVTGGLNKRSVGDLVCNEQERSHVKKELERFDGHIRFKLHILYQDRHSVPSIAKMDARAFWLKCKSRYEAYPDRKDRSESMFQSGWDHRYKNSAFPTGYVLVSAAVENNNLVAARKILQGALLAKRDGLADERDFMHKHGHSLLQAKELWGSLTPEGLRLILSANIIAVNPTTGGPSPLSALCKGAPAERRDDLMRILLDAGATPNPAGQDRTP